MMLESDCASVVDSLQAREQDRSIIAPIIRDTLLYARGLMAISFRREQNKIAHELAHLASRLNECQVLLNSPHESVSNLVCNELT